jgi:hypothetical protein
MSIDTTISATLSYFQLRIPERPKRRDAELLKLTRSKISEL